MKKKLILVVLFFLGGVVFSTSSYSFFRKTIQNLYQWSTNEAIQFYGKDFYFFEHPVYYISFGFVFSLFIWVNAKWGLLSILKQGVLMLCLFSMAIILISSLNANLKVIECTACEGGIRKLGYGEINYNLILISSLVISIIPSSLSLIKNIK